MSLQDFLESYRDVRAQSQGVPGLAAFLDSYGRMRRAMAPAAPAPKRVIDPIAMGSFLAALAEAAEAARSTERIQNIWSVAGLGRNEVRTTAVLAWILNPLAEHGFGDAVMVALLNQLRSPAHDALLSRIKLGKRFRVHTEYCAFGDRDDRVDIAIEGENCVLFLEVKIDAPEGHRQLERYQNTATIRAKAGGKPEACVLYLSKKSSDAMPPEVVPLTWKQVTKSIRRAVATAGSDQEFSGRLLLQFARHINRFQ